jgi:hypothetical protein
MRSGIEKRGTRTSLPLVQSHAAFSESDRGASGAQPSYAQTRSVTSCAVSTRGGSTTARLPCPHVGSMGFSQGLVLGSRHATRRPPRPCCLLWRLGRRRQVRTSWLWCHAALSHTTSSACVPRAPKRSLPQASDWVVRPLTGCPVANRRQSWSGGGGGAPQQPIASQGLGGGIICGRGGFPQAPRLRLRRPGLQGRRRQATPPDRSTNAQHPRGRAGCQVDQVIPLVCFRAYAGSGLVIQGWARFQRVLRAARAWRIVSPLTCRGVIPSA